MMIWLFHGSGNVDFFPASLVWLLIVILKMQYKPSGESLQALTPGKVSHLALDWKPSRRSCTRLRNESDRNGSLGWLSGVILLFSIVQIFMSAAISYFYRTQNSVSHVWNLFQIVGFVKIDTWISISCYMDLSKLLHGQSFYMDLSILFLALCQTKPRLSWTKVVEASALN